MTTSQLFSVLKARWLLFAAILALAVVSTLVVSLLLPKQYTAEASVVVDVKSPDPIVGALPGMISPGYMATQIDIVQSERVALGVVRALRLNEVESLRESWLEETKGVGNFEGWVAQFLQKKLEVRPSRESNVIHITFTAADPKFAAAVANSFVQSYLKTTLDLRVEPARQYSQLFDDQAKQHRERLAAAQERLSRFQRDNGIVVADERFDAEVTRMNQLSSQLAQLQGQSADSASRKAQTSSNSAEVLSNPVVAGLKADLARQEAKLHELSAQFGPAHPQVAQIRASIEELSNKVAQETSRVQSSVGITSAVNQGTVARVRQELSEQKEKVQKLKAQRDQALVMLKDVENAQRAFDAVEVRLNQASLESQSNRTNVSVLRDASPPHESSSPRVFLNTFLSFFLGGLVALLAVMAVELRDRRIRIGDDVTHLLDLPVLGTLKDARLRVRSGSGKKNGGGGSNVLGQRGIPELTAPVQS